MMLPFNGGVNGLMFNRGLYMGVVYLMNVGVLCMGVMC